MNFQLFSGRAAVRYRAEGGEPTYDLRETHDFKGVQTVGEGLYGIGLASSAEERYS